VLWAALIFTLSTDTFSSQHTGGVILVALRWVLPHAHAETLDLIHLLIRKTAHVSEYFVFSLLLLQAIRGIETGWKLRWAILALLIASSYAALDEFHQSFVPSRTASPRDVLLDATGATLAQIAAWRVITREQRSVLVRSPDPPLKN
jgi:VanZ family protein